MSKQTIAAVLIILSAWMTQIGKLQAAEANHYKLALAFYTQVGSTSEFFCPLGIAIDTKGDIFVTASTHGAEEYGPDGQWIRSFGS